MEKESLFLSYIRLTLKKWIGFQAALEEGMGGPYAKEKELWMGNEIENYFKRYSHVTPDDIEDYIGAMLENEFDTYFEDGSLLEISKNFCQAFELSSVNPKSPMFEEVLKNLKTSSSSPQCPRQSSQSEVLKNLEASSVLSHTSETTQNEKVNAERSVEADMEQLSVNGTDEDQWTVVTKKSHKK